MADVQITCTTKNPLDNTHESVTHLANSESKWSSADVICWIQSSQNTFYALANNARVDAAVVNRAPRKVRQDARQWPAHRQLPWLPEFI